MRHAILVIAKEKIICKILDRKTTGIYIHDDLKMKSIFFLLKKNLFRFISKNNNYFAHFSISAAQYLYRSDVFIL